MKSIIFINLQNFKWWLEVIIENGLRLEMKFNKKKSYLLHELRIIRQKVIDIFIDLNEKIQLFW